MTPGQGHRHPRRTRRTAGIADASVVEGALRRGDLIVSSDEGDLATITGAVSRHIVIDHP